MSIPFNPMPFLRTSRAFPQDAQALSVELDRMNVDVANAVNSRSIGLYPTTKPALTGKVYYLSENVPRPSFHQVFTFSAAGNIAHNIPNLSLNDVVQFYGSFNDGTNVYQLSYVAGS